MRKVTAGLFISLDGVVEAPNLWQFDVFDEDMAANMLAYLNTEDAILLGRVTYQEWADYWPNASDEPYASHINDVPKYVVSNTLDRVGWGRFDNARLIRGGNLADEVARLKQEPGKNIGVAGSPTLVRSMLHDGLLDTLTLMFHPVVVGHGKHLFKDGDALKRMDLVDSQTTRSGVVTLTYQPRSSG